MVPKINPDEQLSYILGDLRNFFLIMGRSIYINFTDIVISYIGVLGWMEVRLPIIYYMLTIIILLSIAVFDNNKRVSINSGQKILSFSVFIMGLILFLFTMYLSWNEVGDEIVNNMQGRYFIPIVPLLIMIFYNNKYQLNKNIIAGICIIFIITSCIITNQAILSEYY